MSTSKHKNGRTYRYSFYHLGVRFHGPTGCTTKAAADKFEAKVRAQLEMGIQPAGRQPEMSLREAAGRFWEEKAQHEKNHKTVFGQLRNLTLGLGPNTLLSRITNDDLSRYQAKQRAERGVGARTINAEVPELIGRLLGRARLWGVALPTLNLRELRIRVAAPRVRELTEDEERRLFAALRRDYHPIVHFALATGLRRNALLVRRDAVDFEAGVLRYPRKSRATGDVGILPLTRRTRVILRRAIAVGKDPDFVFTYVCARTRDGRRAGARYPITSSGLRRAVEAAITAAGIPDWRTVHDFRHTAATRVLRRSKNLKAVQGMLGHSDIAQTSRYAHALLEDVRLAMED